jgi:EAL domain-containing protein (putative c-di-GMP-specific phosphodiesterase class I)
VIVEAVIALARALRLNLTAEGIETSHQWQELVGLGCDQGQGYFFARPLQARAFVEVLQHGATPPPEQLAA